MVTRIGPMIPGLGVNYTSPANAPRSNAINIRQTGATSGEANRYANMAPAGTTTSPLSRPASANSALGLGERNASVVPPSLSSTRAPSPVPTLIPGALDMQGRMGGAGVSTTPTGGIRATPPVPGIGDSLYAQTPGANLPGGTTPIPGRSGTGAGGGSSEPGLPATGARPAAGGSTAPGGSGAASDAAGDAESGAGAGAGASPIDAAAALDAAINQLLDPEFIGFQGDRAAELRRLQNLRNQLFGDAEFGQTGSVQRQEGLDEQSRRRLAAQRASAGMLQGGAYGGTERGLGTLQRADQDFAMQEMQRPFREQTAPDRLREFGLEFDPTNRAFNQQDMDLTGFTTQTQAGRQAAARARLAAIQQLAQQGIQI